ncbi:MAG: hypothetical protein K6E40_00090 [Desulfovibrio sp.]|nr:hypothetical protein [Desulfovibrio sp.]
MQVNLSITAGIINPYDINIEEEKYILDDITKILQIIYACREEALLMLNASQSDDALFSTGKLILNTYVNSNIDIRIAQAGLASKWNLNFFVSQQQDNDENSINKDIIHKILHTSNEQTPNISYITADTIDTYIDIIYDVNKKNIASSNIFLHLIKKSDLLIIPYNEGLQSHENISPSIQLIIQLKKPVILIPYGVAKSEDFDNPSLHQNDIRYFLKNNDAKFFEYSKECDKEAKQFMFECLFYGQNSPFSEYQDDYKKLLECIHDTNAKIGIFTKFFSNSWNFVLNILAPVEKKSSVSADVPQEMLEILSIFDNLAGRYAKFYRSYFLWMPILGALAVTFATCGIALPFSLPIVLGLGLSELIILFIILFLYYNAHNGRWQEKFADYRLLAEIFRVNTYLFSIDFSYKMHDTLPNYAVRGIVWKEFLVKMLMRNYSNTNRECNLEKGREILNVFLDDQISYHTCNVKQLEKVEHSLHFLMTALFFISLLCGITHIVMEIVHILHIPILAKVLALLTVLLPLYSMVAHAISQYADIHRLAIRSKTIIVKLKSIKKLNKKSKNIKPVAYSIAETMLSDVTEWNVQSQMNHVALG